VVFNRTGVVASVIFSSVLMAASGFLAFDVFLPSPAPHALMNAEGIVALSFLAVLLCAERKVRARPRGPVFRCVADRRGNDRYFAGVRSECSRAIPL